MRAPIAAIMATLTLVPIQSRADHVLGGADLAAGETLYADNCASCHGADLEGQPDWRSPGPDGILPAPPHDENGHTWHHDSAMLFDYTKFGGQAALEARGVTGFTSGMPGFGDSLSDEEIRDVLAYIRSTWPDQVQDVQAARSHVPDEN
ncbi:MAG: c-type cytochrome [Maritimibacter harenae]